METTLTYTESEIQAIWDARISSDAPILDPRFDQRPLAVVIETNEPMRQSMMVTSIGPATPYIDGIRSRTSDPTILLQRDRLTTNGLWSTWSASTC
jgi:hypothetical protein